MIEPARFDGQKAALRGLGATAAQMQWVLDGYLLFLGAPILAGPLLRVAYPGRGV